MKIALYSGAIPSSVFIERLLVGLAERGIDVLLFGPIKQKVRYKSINIKILGFKSKAHLAWLFMKYILLLVVTRPEVLLKFIRVLRQTKQNFSFRLVVQFLGVLWHLPDILHIQWAKSLSQWIWVKEFGTKVVLSLRGAHINYSPLADKALAGSYMTFFPEVDAFHAVSSAIASESVKYGADILRIKVIHSGLDIREFTFQPHWKQQDEVLKIISVGRPHWIKGYDKALDALGAFKKEGLGFHFTIIGGASEELLYQINDLHLIREVSIMDNLPFTEVKKQIQSSHLMLLPSVEEGIANVVLESMALGTLVLSSNCGGMKELVEDGANGFLFQNRDSAALINQLKRINTLKNNEVNEILRKARNTIEKSFNHRQMVDGFVDLYTSSLSTH